MAGRSYKKFVFKNGLCLLVIPMPKTRSVTAQVLVGAGSRYEPSKLSGISHFLEHMAFKGTKKRPSTQAIASLIEGIGGEFNASTGKDHTDYYIKATAEHLPLALDVLADMLTGSLFKKEEIEKERRVILEEMNMREDMPIYKVGEVFEEVLYGKTPLGRRIIGEKEVIKKLKREDFLNFLKRYYSPKNTVVAIAGGVRPKKACFLVERYFGGWAKKPIKEFKKQKDKQKRPALALVYKKTEQAHLCVGVRAYSLFHPDRFALSLLSAILGGGMSSRLFLEVREKRGLAYYIRSSTQCYQDVGYFVTQAGVDIKRIEEAIKVILGEYKKIKEKLKREELARAKEYLKGRLILELEDSKSMASLFGSQEVLERKIKTPEEIIGEINKVKREDVLRVAEDILRAEKLNLAIVGPYKSRQRFEKLLRL